MTMDQRRDEARRAWVSRLPEALVTGRGLLVSDLSTALDDSWWPGVAAWDAIARREPSEGFEIAVFDGVSAVDMEDPALCLRFLQAATTAVFERRPIVAG